MKLKELEKAINEKIESEGIKEEKLSNWEIVDKVRRIVNSLINSEENDEREVYVTDYKGTVLIRRCLSRNYDFVINIKIKKKVAGKRSSVYSWHECTLYNIVSINIEENESYDSIEGFIEFHNKLEEQKENYEKSKTEKFEAQLSDINIDFKMFYDIMENYKNLSYNEKEKLAKKYAGKEYYKYF